MGDSYETKYTGGKPVNTVQGASPARGKPAKTSIYNVSKNELPAVGPLKVGTKDDSKPKGY